VSAFADVTLGRGPAAIHRISGSRVAEVTAKVASTDLGEALAELRARLGALDLPTGVVAEPAGQDEELPPPSPACAWPCCSRCSWSTW
jgi:multidrug efflux pump subunit AcrB